MNIITTLILSLSLPPAFSNTNIKSLRGKKADVASKALEQHRVLQFLHWWDCNVFTEEPCFDEHWNIISCARYDEGGCKCPPGQIRCGATNFFKGYCASMCCDPETEVSCWEMNENFKFDVTDCAPIEEGCPCPEGQSRCGPNETPSGLCSPVCCDSDTSYFCFTVHGLDFNAYCVDIADGHC